MLNSLPLNKPNKKELLEMRGITFEPNTPLQFTRAAEGSQISQIALPLWKKGRLHTSLTQDREGDFKKIGKNSHVQQFLHGVLAVFKNELFDDF